jgi:cytochrome c553
VAAGECVQCHLGGFEGTSGVPRLAGQYPEYLEKTMRDYKTKARAKAPHKSTLLASFSDAQIAALAALLAGM